MGHTLFVVRFMDRPSPIHARREHVSSLSDVSSNRPCTADHQGDGTTRSGDRTAPPQGLRARVDASTDRDVEDAAVGERDERPRAHDLRGSRRSGKGRSDQAVHGTHEPTRCQGGRAEQADRTRAHAVVLPALRGPAPVWWRDRVLRSFVVQPRRRGDRHGLRRPTPTGTVLRAAPRFRATSRRLGHPRVQALVHRFTRRATPQVRRETCRSAQAVETEPER